MIVLAVLISVAFVTTVFAQAQKEAKPTAPAPAPEKKAAAPAPAAEKKAAAPAPAEKKAEKKEAAPKTHQFTGEVTAVDMAAKTLTGKNQKGEKVFDIANVKMKAEPKVGDKVLVKFVEKDGKNIANSVAVTKAAKKAEAKKEAPKKEEKPAAAAAPAPAPAKAAPAPAPAKK